LEKKADMVIYNSEITLGIYKKLIYKNMNMNFLDKFKYIESIRNTTEWQDINSRDWLKHNSSSLYKIDSGNKVKVLFIHSNFMASINKDEVRRAVKILNRYDCFQLGIRPHIRLGKITNASEVKYLFKGVKSYEVFYDSLLESILWSDVVVFYGASAVIDALLLQKYVVFLRFATSNKLDDYLNDNIVVCDTPDDFIFECEDLSNNIFKKTQQLKTPNLDELLNKWSDLLGVAHKS